MHSSTPKAPGAAPGPPGGRHAGDHPGFTAELAAAVSGARRRAARAGDHQIDTAHLLHSLLESVPDVRAAIGDGAQTARVLGYLVQRSIGYGLRWQESAEEAGLTSPEDDCATGWSGWSPAAAAAARRALRRAGARGAARADALDLLAAMTSDPACRAVDVLRRAGVACAWPADGAPCAAPVPTPFPAPRGEAAPDAGPAAAAAVPDREEALRRPPSQQVSLPLRS
ncbi:peptidase [Streptomyces sp. CC228A]|uniref:peptidase n=1 Tax=Streptomyces sp. CC228A TaxID=2898186 RepID=UPI0035A9AAB8